MSNQEFAIMKDFLTNNTKASTIRIRLYRPSSLDSIPEEDEFLDEALRERDEMDEDETIAEIQRGIILARAKRPSRETIKRWATTTKRGLDMMARSTYDYEAASRDANTPWEPLRPSKRARVEQ